MLLHLLLGRELSCLLLFEQLLLHLDGFAFLFSLDLGLLGRLLLLLSGSLHKFQFVSFGLSVHLGLVQHLDFGASSLRLVLRLLGFRELLG